jgi:hypothetical protein
MVPYSITQRLHYMAWPTTRSDQVIILFVARENGLHFRKLQSSRFLTILVDLMEF